MTKGTFSDVAFHMLCITVCISHILSDRNNYKSIAIFHVKKVLFMHNAVFTPSGETNIDLRKQYRPRSDATELRRQLMEFQNLFFWKNEKINSNCCLFKFLPGVLSDNMDFQLLHCYIIWKKVFFLFNSVKSLLDSR